MTRFSTPSADLHNCNHLYGSKGGKGVTIWGPYTFYLLPGQTSDPLYFTFTEPQCYKQKTDPPQTATTVCNLTFSINIGPEPPFLLDADVGPIKLAINQDTPYYSYSESYRSKVYSDEFGVHDVTETHDIWQSKYNGEHLLNDVGTNFIRFTNESQNVVGIKNLRIIRVYDMCGLDTDREDQCHGSIAGQCLEGASHPVHPDFTTRYDYPCNLKDCGSLSEGITLSESYFDFDDHVKRIHAGDANMVSWNWTNPVNPANNYIGPKSCLFNFNNVALDGETQKDDVRFSIRVNNGSWAHFFHTKVPSHHMAHSVDLVTHPILSQSYNDAPGATNYLDLKLEPDVPDLVLCDGCDALPCPEQCEGGRVNIYRIYKTKTCCPTINASSVGSGTINPSGGPHPVSRQGLTFNMAVGSGYYLSDIKIDSVSKGAINPYTVHPNDLSYPGLEGHHIVAYFEQEHTLTTPSVGGPASGYRNITYDFSACSEDSAGHNIKYTFNWGDGTQTVTGWCLSGHSAPAQHSWTTTGQKTITVKAQCTGGLVKWANPHTNIQNRYPTIPTLNGPSSGYRGISYQFSAVSTDPDGDTIRYEFNWSDGTTTTTGYYSSGATAYASHAWSSAGTFQVTVRAQDSAGSGWTYPSNPAISFSSIEASPSVPTVTGPSPPTYINTNYQFSAVSTDPNGDTIRYRFQWGDGTPDTYTGYYASGQTAYASHAWTSAGTFQMYVFAEDSTGRTNYPRPVTVNIQNPTYYSIYFDAWTYYWDGQWYQVNVGFTVDGNPYTTPTTVPLLAGNHTVTFPDCIGIGTIVGLDHEHDGTHDYYYSNQATVYIGSTGSITASYHC